MLTDHFTIQWNATSEKCANVQDRLSSILVIVLWLLRTRKSYFDLLVGLLQNLFFFPFYLASGNQAGKQQHYPIGGVCNVLLFFFFSIFYFFQKLGHRVEIVDKANLLAQGKGKGLAQLG